MDKNFLSDLKAANPIIDTARRLGLELFKSGSEYRTYSIFEPGHNQTATILSPARNYFWDFKASRGGDVIDLVAVVKFNGNKGEAINDLSGGRARDCGQKFEAYLKNLTADIERWHAALRSEDVEYLMSRGLTREYINRMRLGYDAEEQRLIIPYLEHGKPVYYVGRDRSGREDTAKYKKDFLNGFNSNILWGLHSLERAEKPLVVAEGVFDAISFDIAGFRVLSSATGSSYRDREIIREYAKHEQEQGRALYICFDNDDAGAGFFKGLAMELVAHKIYNFKRLPLPVRFKDISEYFAAGGNLQVLIDEATDGLMSFADSFSPELNETQAQSEKRHAGFKSFMLKAARFVDKAELSRLVDRMIQQEYFKPRWLNEILKMATNAPLEDDIIEAILKERDLIFDVHSGFYEYTGIRWVRTSDTRIDHFIRDELGRFYSTGKRLASIRNNLKAKIEEACEFDIKPILAFQNGVLEIETGNFRRHDKKDMNTIVLHYNYDPVAHSQRWADFLMAVTWSPTRNLQDADGDARIAVLQEFAGYALFPDCRHDKALMILGEGANGKSAFLNAIKSAFGQENCASVEIDRLNQNFQAVQLIGKMLSFTSEQSLNFSGAEAKFKALTSGEALSDSFKGRDVFQFNTRAKFIVAANELPASRDKSYGFLRRFIFVSFPNKFITGEPIPENNERLADPRLKAKDAFHDELPAIFNWIYAGYKRLVQQGRFTNSPDQIELEQAFAAGNNPLIDFVIDRDFVRDDTFRSWTELYKDYREWTTQSGYAPMGRRSFIMNFKRALQNQQADYYLTQAHSGERGIKFNFDFASQIN